jgi:hypothetical protein
LVVGDGLLVQGEPVASGLSHHWPQNYPHRYDNPSSLSQVVLCIDHPPFLPDDERLVASQQNLEPLRGARRRQWWVAEQDPLNKIKGRKSW